MRRSVLGVGAALAAVMGGLGQDAEVLPREAPSPEPAGLGEWLRRNNRRRETDGAFGSGRAKQQRQRLQRATGPGSLNETNELRALIEGGQKHEAAAYYERCKQINYRAGRPKMRWGDVWYFAYKAAVARGEIT